MSVMHERIYNAQLCQSLEQLLEALRELDLKTFRRNGTKISSLYALNRCLESEGRKDYWPHFVTWWLNHAASETGGWIYIGGTTMASIEAYELRIKVLEEKIAKLKIPL